MTFEGELQPQGRAVSTSGGSATGGSAKTMAACSRLLEKWHRQCARMWCYQMLPRLLCSSLLVLLVGGLLDIVTGKRLVQSPPPALLSPAASPQPLQAPPSPQASSSPQSSKTHPRMAADSAHKGKTQMKLHLFEDHHKTDVKCMDGTSSGFYFAPASVQPNYYVLFLQGGGWCYDRTSCDQRCHQVDGICTGEFSTSTGWPTIVSLAGLFSSQPSRSPLFGANKAYLRYCTGDAHMGNRDASIASFGYSFHGQRAVEATLEILHQQYGLGANPNQTLLFGGGSAGARGAMVILDDVPNILARLSVPPGQVRVLGFLDSPYWIDVKPFNKGRGSIAFAEMTRAMLTVANISGHMSPRCSAAYSSELWKCAFGVYRMPFVMTPYMMIASLADQFQIDMMIGHHGPTTAEELAYVKEFVSTTHKYATALVEPGAYAVDAGSTVFSMNCYSHSTSLTDYGMSEMSVAGWKMRDALAAFMGFTGHQKLPTGGLLDSPTGFATGLGCSK